MGRRRLAPALRAAFPARAGRRARGGDDGARCAGFAGGLCAGCCSQGPALARAIAGHGAADDAKWRERREGMRRRNGEGGRVPVCLCACGCCCGCVRARTCAISVHTQTEFQQPHTERLREQSRAERERERESIAGRGDAAPATAARRRPLWRQRALRWVYTWALPHRAALLARARAMPWVARAALRASPVAPGALRAAHPPARWPGRRAWRGGRRQREEEERRRGASASVPRENR